MNDESKMPVVTVGIMTAPRVEIVLHGAYRRKSDGAKVEGTLTAQCGDATETYIPLEADSRFEVRDVTIGVDFHWQRRENQVFGGALTLKAVDGGITVINTIGVEDYLRSVISSFRLVGGAALASQLAPCPDREKPPCCHR